jgi:hypothetical protein
MLEEYNREQLWEIYKKLPEELKEAVFSEKISDNIDRICQKNGIEDSSKVSEAVGFVLLGVLPLEELQETLKRELRIKLEVAKKISQEINRFVLFPLKRNLDSLHEKEPFAPALKPEIKAKSEIISTPEEKSSEPRESVSPRKDTYRESLDVE